MRRDEALTKVRQANEGYGREADPYPKQLLRALEAIGLIKFDEEPRWSETQWCFQTRDGGTCPPIRHSDLKKTLEANGYILVEPEALRPKSRYP